MRLRYTLVATTLGAGIDDDDTAVTFAGKLTGVEGDVPTISSPDYLPLLIGDPASPGGCEVAYLTDYTTGATAGTILRGQGGSTAQAHASGVRVVNAVLPGDVIVTDAESTGAPVVTSIVTITQGDYDALDPPDPNTLYIIVEVE